MHSQCGSCDYKKFVVKTNGHSQLLIDHIDYFIHRRANMNLVALNSYSQLSCVCDPELCNHVSKPGTSPCAISTCPSNARGLCWAIGHSYSLAVWATVSDLLKFPPESYKPIIWWIINKSLMWLHESVSLAHPNHLQLAVEFIKKICQ